MNLKYKFLSGILGKDGSDALRKAIQKEPALQSVVLPRSIIGWLNSTQETFEDEIPGIENSYLNFSKSEDLYTGSIAIGDIVHNFSKTDIYHLSSAILLALGEEKIEVDDRIRDLVLMRLGKSIDALAQAQEVARNLSKTLSIPSVDLTKAISAIPAGKEVEGGHDYSHVLKPEHREAGYSLKVQPGVISPGKDVLEANLYRHGNPDPIGTLEAHSGGKGILEPSVAMIQNEHKGKGLGQAMYEAMFAHGFHNGIHTIRGDVHSSDASGVHKKLAQKHGLNYEPQKNLSAEKFNRPEGANDQKYGPYQYTLKKEPSLDKANTSGLPGPSHQPTAQAGPLAPMQPIAKQPKMRNVSKVPPLKVEKSLSDRPCDFCEGTQFKDDKFVGCICFQSEAPLVKTVAYKDGYVLEFKREVSTELFLALSDYFRS